MPSRRRKTQAMRNGELLQRLGPDGWLLLPACALAGLGLVMVASVAPTFSAAHDSIANSYYMFYRHMVFLGMGVVAALLAAAVPTHWLERSSRPLLLLSLLLVCLPLVPGLGVEKNDATRWIRFGPVDLQVVEAAKLAVVVYVAGYLARRAPLLRVRLFDTVKPLAVVMVMGVILDQHPDLGSAVVLAVVVFGMLFLAGAAWRHMFLLTGASASLFAMAATSTGYQQARLTTFLDPFQDPTDSGYQLIQSFVAIARGEWFGVGLGGSVQKLQYLPEALTDFIFAVLAEEMGLLGVVLVLGLYTLLVARILVIGAQAHAAGRPFAGYLAWGLGLWIGMQSLTNIGVNMGVLPTKGLTLPLISSGGSSLLVTCITIGLLVRIKLDIDREALGPQGLGRAGEMRHVG